MLKNKTSAYLSLLILLVLARPINAQCPSPIIVASSNSICAGNSVTLTSVFPQPIVTFTSLGATTWTAPSGVTTVTFLIVAGGGSGGVDNGGGAGGGGVLTGTTSVTSGQSYAINVGAGGAARPGSSDHGPGNNGGNSSAFGLTAIGGSGGTGWTNSPLPPGSVTYTGGSGAGQSAETGGVHNVGAGAPISGQGFAGGTAVGAYGGGGGGKGGAGGNASSGNVGAGGDGLYVGATFGNSIGVNGYVAGGGAGGFDHANNYSSTLPFTRNGTVKKLNQTAEDPCPNNTGAGGNGSNHNNVTSGAGGSGIVIIKYNVPSAASYTWSTGANTSSIVVSPSVTTTYSVVSTNTAACSATSAPITITVTQLTAQITGANTVCAGNSLTLTATSGAGASNALNFDGVDDYVETNSNITNLNNGDFTIEAWVKTTGTALGLVVCANNNNAWEAGEKAFYINSGGQPAFVGNGNSFITSIGSATVNNNVWRHVAVVWDWTSGNSGIGKMYVDGVDVTGPVNYASNNPNLGTFKLGRANFFGSEAPNFFNGTMDEVRIWNIARTQPQIAANNSVTIPSNSSGLVAYYQFNEFSGITTADITGNLNTGSLTNGPTWQVPSTAPISATGLANGTFTWSNGANTSSITINPTVTTSYSVVFTTTAGCIGSSSLTAVNVNPLPVLSISGSSAICVGQTATLVANGANTYTWSNASTASSITLSPASNTSYSLTGTAAGCIGSATRNLTVNPNPIITVNNGTICAGQNFTINPNGANTYTIQGGNAVVSPAANTSYTVAGTSAAGCVSQALATSSLIVNPNPIITVNNGTICAGQSFTINPNGANTYTIQGGNPVVSPLSNAIFTVSGTSGAGCVSQAVATSSLIVNPNPTITVNNGTICVGQNFTINPNGANTYTIQGGNAVVSPPSNSSYTVIGTNSVTGCRSQAFATSSLVVNQNPIITVNSGAICAGQSFTINPNGANTYTIQGGNPVVSPPSNAVFTVAGTSTAGCVSQAFATSSLIVNQNPTITVNNGAICAGQNFTINPNGANTYTIQGANAVVSPSINTTYTVIGTNTITGCRSQSFATSNLTVNPNPTVSISGASGICTGQNASLTANGATTYTWSTGSTSASIITTPTANTTYTLTGSTPQGCSSFTTQLVTVQLSLSVSIAGPTTVCYGEPANISGLGGVTYTWNTGATSSTIAPTLTTTTTFSLIGASGTCSNTASTTISVTPNPTITITGTNAICAGGSTSLTVNGATTYTWSSGSTSASVVFSPSATSVYSVVGSYSTGCLNTLIDSVIVYTLPLVSISGPSVVCLGDSISLVANGANTYVWNNNATTTTIVITPTTTSTYSAVGTDTNGCVGLSEIDSIFVNPVPIISIASTATTICVGEGVTLTANGANTYTWSGGINTNSIAVSPSVSTTYSASGSGTNSCVGRNTLQIIVSECTSINSIASKAAIKVYPNPNNGEFTIELTNINNSNITITNVLGQIIKTQKAELMNQIDLNLFDKGIYFINVMENNQSVYRGSIIKQ